MGRVERGGRRGVRGRGRDIAGYLVMVRLLGMWMHLH